MTTDEQKRKELAAFIREARRRSRSLPAVKYPQAIVEAAKKQGITIREERRG